MTQARKTNYLTASAVNIAMRLISALVAVATLAFITREVTKEEFALYAIAISFVMLVTGLIELGFQTSYVSIVSKYNRNAKLQHSVVQIGALLRIITVVVGMLLIYGVILLSRYIDAEFPKLPESIVYSCLFTASGYAFYYFAGAHLRALGSFYLSSLVLSAVPMAQFFVVIFLYYFEKLSVNNILVGYALFSLGSIIILQAITGFRSWNLLELKKHKKKLLVFYSLFSGIGFANIIEVIAVRIDIFMIDYMVNEHAVSDYFTSHKLASASMIVSTAISFIVLPLVMKFHGWNNLEKRRKILINYVSIVLLLAVLSFFTFSLFGKDVLFLIYGNVYRENYMLLMLLSGSISFGITLSGVAAFLLKDGNSSVILHLALINVILLIAGNLVFIPKFDEYGAALSNIMSYAAMSFYAWLRILSTNFPVKTLTRWISDNVLYSVFTIAVTMLSILYVVVDSIDIIVRLVIFLGVSLVSLLLLKIPYQELISEIG